MYKYEYIDIYIIIIIIIIIMIFLLLLYWHELSTIVTGLHLQTKPTSTGSIPIPQPKTLARYTLFHSKTIWAGRIPHENHHVFNAGWWYTYPSEKYEFVNWDDDIPNIWKNKKCSKTPTRMCVHSQISAWICGPVRAIMATQYILSRSGGLTNGQNKAHSNPPQKMPNSYKTFNMVNNCFKKNIEAPSSKHVYLSMFICSIFFGLARRKSS